MNAQDKERFMNLVSEVMVFYNRSLSVLSISIWWQACERFDFEQVSKAFSAHATDAERGRFPPMPADIVRVLQGTQTDRALVAWGKVMEAVQRVGAYRSAVFDDGAIHVVIEDMGGWVTVCRSATDELPFLQRRFCETYRAYVMRPDFSFPAVLPGESEKVNLLNGRSVQPPVLVGDATAAMRVMTLGRKSLRVAISQLDMLPAVETLSAA